jgi:hypothetical protein
MKTNMKLTKLNKAKMMRDQMNLIFGGTVNPGSCECLCSTDAGNSATGCKKAEGTGCKVPAALE